MTKDIIRYYVKTYRAGMRLFRGITVPHDTAEATLAEIVSAGIVSNVWLSHTVQRRADPILLHKANLTYEDTRTPGSSVPAACACGTVEGALHYASKHNRSGTNDTPVIIEFDADVRDMAIDGSDLLYTVLTHGNPRRAALVIEQMFGSAGLKYARMAWVADPSAKLAIGDLMMRDPEVISPISGVRSPSGAGTAFLSGTPSRWPCRYRRHASRGHGFLNLPPISCLSTLITHPC